jgi:hypothetical protein
MVRYSASGGQVIRQIRETPPDSQGRGLGFPRLGPQIQAAELGNRGKEELQAYLSEITGFPEREYFRPNFFVNTPDILPFHLQSGEPWIFKDEWRWPPRFRAITASTMVSGWWSTNRYPVRRNISTPTNMN